MIWLGIGIGSLATLVGVLAWITWHFRDWDV